MSCTPRPSLADRYDEILVEASPFVGDGDRLERYLDQRLEELAAETGIPLQQLSDLYCAYCHLGAPEVELIERALADGASWEQASSAAAAEIARAEIKLLAPYDLPSQWPRGQH